MCYVLCNFFFPFQLFIFRNCAKNKPKSLVLTTCWEPYSFKSFHYFIKIILSWLKIILAHTRLSSLDIGNLSSLVCHDKSYSVLTSDFSKLSGQVKPCLLHVSILKHFTLEKRWYTPCLPGTYLPTQISKLGSEPIPCCFLPGKKIFLRNPPIRL